MTLASSILSCYLIFGRQLYSPSGGTRVRYRMQKLRSSQALLPRCRMPVAIYSRPQKLIAISALPPSADRSTLKNAVNDNHIKLLSSLSYYLPRSIFSGQFITGITDIRIDFHGRRSHRRPAVEKVNHNIPYTTIYFIVVIYSFFVSNF